MLQPVPVLSDGTIEDLLADARIMGRKATQRMVLDWQSLGLLDYPAAQGGLGRGQGSRKALYSANQRKLFRALLEQRSRNTRVRPLTNLPVYLWLYWGNDYVPLSQAQRALKTYVKTEGKTHAKAYNPSKERARQLADELATQLEHPAANDTQRTKLRRLLSEAIAQGRAMDAELADVAQQVFDPEGQGRILGPPGARLTVSALLQDSLRQHRVVHLLLEDKISGEVFESARAAALETFREYMRLQPEFAASAGDLAHLFQPLTEGDVVRKSCSNLMALLALHSPHQPAQQNAGDR